MPKGSGAKLKADCEARGIPFEIIHTSGHASIADLKRLAAAVRPKALVPIHTFEAERFPSFLKMLFCVRMGNGGRCERAQHRASASVVSSLRQLNISPMYVPSISPTDRPGIRRMTAFIFFCLQQHKLHPDRAVNIGEKR